MSIVFGIPFPDDTETPTLGLSDTARRPKGVFAEQPGMTPKYARNQGQREPDYRETMARLFIQVGPDEYERFVASVRARDPRSEPLARVLAGTNDGFGGSNGGVGYIDFLLQQAPISIQEDISIVKTLADNYVLYTFGQNPPVFTYSGVLLNTLQDDQALNMYRVYRDMIRATQLARRKKTVRLRYDSYIVNGVATALTMTQSAGTEMSLPFTLTLVVKSITLLPNDEYGLVVLNDSFANKDILPKLQSGVLNTGVKPVRLSLVPPVITTRPTTQDPQTPTYSVKDVMQKITTPDAVQAPVIPKYLR
jgi:hypothetical protein